MPAHDSSSDRYLSDLYTDNRGWLQRWLQRKSGCSERAADLMQDTFVRFITRPNPEPPRDAQATLMAIAKNLLVDHWRRARLEQAYLDALASRPEAVATGPEERHLIIETLLQVERLLDGLPAVAKQAFLMSQLDGMKQAEIASALSISISSVKRYLTQALTQCYFAELS